jgi:hypothetical protein
MGRDQDACRRQKIVEIESRFPLAIAHHRDRLSIPVGVRPDIGASFSAGLAEINAGARAPNLGTAFGK